MASRSSFDTRLGALVGCAVLLGVVVLACRPAVTASQPAPTQASAGPTATAALTTGGPSPTAAGREAPPEAFLAAEGGDPVAGQLGSFVWLQSGSDSPWLPGAPIAVGSGEPLTVSLDPDGDIRAWAARYVPADAAGPEGATTLGEGSGPPRFEAPGPGDWTVEVVVEFAAGVGDASYFWRLEVE